MCWTLCVVCVLLMLTRISSTANEPQNNRQLKNHVLRSIQGSSFYHCSSECVADALCASFNFHAPTLVCELNVKTSTEMPSDFVFKKGSLFLNKERIKSNDPCAKITCGSCQVCRVKRGASQPTCVPNDDDVSHSSTCLAASAIRSGTTFLKRDCYDVMLTNNSDGVHTLNAPGVSGFEVYCSQTCGGWLVFQRRMDGTEDFYRTWDEYMEGFGNLTGEFWLGNEKIHNITKQRPYELRIDMEDFEGQRRYARYSSFALDSRENNYTLHIGSYTGDAGDSLSRQNNRRFSAKDVDLDPFKDHCAVLYHGGWWYDTCHNSNLNGHYLGGATTEFATGVVWRFWRGYRYSLKTVEMKMKPTFS